MRWALIFLLILPFAVALDVQETKQVGSNMDLFGDYLAFESDGDVVVFDLKKDKRLFSEDGRSPALFGNTLVFVEPGSGSGEVLFVKFHGGSVRSTKAKGTGPLIFADDIIFAALERDLDVDFSGDGDTDDSILMFYDIESGLIENTKMAGSSPVISKEGVALITLEENLGADANGDGDADDGILRIYDRETKKAASIPISARPPLTIHEESVVFEDGDGELVLVDINTHQVLQLDVQGRNPSLSGDRVAFERDGFVHVLNIVTGSIARLDAGSSPSLDGDVVVFNSPSGKILRIREGDQDLDGALDFDDPCPEDALDDCGSEVAAVGVPVQDEVEPVQELVVEEPIEEDGKVSAKAHPERDTWKWVVLILLVLSPFLIKYGYRYYKRRQKSFGF